MTSSEYIPVNKQQYLKRLVELEAENKALNEKIKIYEDLLKQKIKTTNEKPTKIQDYPIDIQQDSEALNFKQSVFSYMKNPTEDNLSSPIVNYLTNKHQPKITSENIKEFL